LHTDNSRNSKKSKKSHTINKNPHFIILRVFILKYSEQTTRKKECSFLYSRKISDILILFLGQE